MTQSGLDEANIISLTMQAILESADATSSLRWLSELGIPIAQAQDIASLLQADLVEMRVTGAQILANCLSQQQGDVVSAAALWRALIELFVRSPLDSPLRVEMLVTCIMSYGAIAVDAGESQALIEHASTWAEILRRNGRSGTASDLRVREAEALMSQGHYERARDLLAAEQIPGLSGALAPVVARLEQKLDQILRRPDERVGVFDPERVLALTRQWLKSEPGQADALAHTGLRVDAGIEEAMEGVNHPAFPQPPRDLETLAHEVAQLETSRTPVHHLQAVFHSCVSTLGEAGNDPLRLNVLGAIVPGVIGAADRFGIWEDATSARWIEAIILKRLGRKHEALARLQELGARIDERRLLISDPRLRAGVAVYLRHLPWLMAEIAFDLCDDAAALYAIETGKARILSELRPVALTRENQTAPETFLKSIRDLLKKTLSSGRRHLVCFLSDTTAPADAAPGEVGTLALLVPGDGNCTFARIRLSSVQIAAAVTLLHRLVTGGDGLRRAAKIDPAHPEERPFDAAIEVLTPLVSWLKPFFDNGTIAAGDTIIVSADGPIHNVPLGMLPVGSQPLIERAAVINVPTAALLAGRAPAPGPDRAIFYAAPSPGERERLGGVEREGVGILSRRITTRSLTGPELGLDGLLQALGKSDNGGGENLLLHFATHGEVQLAHPLRDKGLALRGSDEEWLTAEQVLALRLAGAHVSLRACVSGVVTEITSREALGLVWAFFGAGTSSMIAAAWNVDIPSAGRFFTGFYEAWLERGMTRAAAYRHAATALRNEGGALAHPYHWAPFILSIATLEGDVA